MAVSLRKSKPDRSTRCATALLLLSLTNIQATGGEVGSEVGILFGDLGRLIEKYAPEAALQAAKNLPMVIDDASSVERARKIIDASARTLPYAGFLQISAEGVCRLYFVNKSNSMVVVSAASILEILASPNFSSRKTLIVDEPSAQAYRLKLESFRSQFDLYTVSGIESPVRMRFNVVAESKTPSETTASATPPEKEQAWAAAEVVVVGVTGLVVFLIARRLYRNVSKGYRGK